MIKPVLLSIFLASSPLSGVNTISTDRHLASLYHSLDSFSIVQNLSFYDLYPNSEEGKESLKRAWELLCGEESNQNISPLTLPKLDLQAVISLVTKQPSDTPIELTDEQLAVMDKIGSKLKHRSLKGFNAWSQKEVLSLPSEEVDLARALLICQFEEEENYKNKILQYEASLDLMALQILARLKPDASSEEMIRQINSFIFQEMGFRFPPHSIYAKDVDLYTFLPSVMDSRLGVCLGVSILYLCISQRLGLGLEIITPPGHIYLRYPSNNGDLNIETTARGIHIPSEHYLGINTRHLSNRTIKQSIGWSFINQASVSWGKKDYETTVKIYEKALPYLPNDPLLQMFLGLNYLFVGRKKEGKALLENLNPLFDYAVSIETLPIDYLNGNVNIEGLKAIFSHVDENRASILDKQAELQKIVKKFPYFRSGLMQLATTYLQLGRTAEALEVLTSYHKIDPNDATVEYYLSALCLERLDYLKSWQYLKNAEALTSARNHQPKALKALRSNLRKSCPDPNP
jgi:tetratricopeptide (TPR) repeat protein